jgi:tripartite-type tricarboxylate transporter receptor subunit TctC
MGEWRFGETSPGTGYSVTTLKDAVDSVLAASTTLSGYSQNDLYWTEEVAGDPTSIPAHKAYEVQDIADLVAAAVNAVGWDLR